MISGYERNVEEARQAIQQLVAELQEMVSQDVRLDPRTHARIIGARGKAIRKLMEEFKVLRLFYIYVLIVFCVHAPSTSFSSRVQVDIRFPQPGSDEPDKVTVTGLPDTVDNAIDHLLNLEEEYVSRCTRFFMTKTNSSGRCAEQLVVRFLKNPPFSACLRCSVSRRRRP